MDSLLQQPHWQSVLRYLDEKAPATVEEIIHIAEIPAPTFLEGRRASYVYERMRDLGLRDVITDEVGNTYGVWPGAASSAPAILVAAHMDTVFPEGTVIEIKRGGGKVTGPGVGDNASNLAAVLAVAEALSSTGLHLRQDVIFAGTVGEEGLGDLRGMRHLMAALGPRVGWVIAADGGLGGLVRQGVGSRRLRLTCLAQGGHSWGSFGAASAVHVLGRIIAEISRLTVPRTPRTTYNVGVVSGGTSINTIAPEAEALIDMRSVDGNELKKLEEKIRRIIEQVSAAASTRYRLDVIGDRPTGSVPADHPLVQAVQLVHRQLFIETRAVPSSTDANIPLHLGVPAVTIGVTTGGNGHLVDEYIYTAPLSKGLQQLALLLAYVQDLVPTEMGLLDRTANPKVR
ncbi:MAG: M20/M25/M40 family metallo-hydrolase [Symbiobacteriia bacterium]